MRLKIYLFTTIVCVMLINPFTINWYSKYIKGYAHCEVCGKSFEFVDHHNIWYKKGSAYFYTCNKCWDSLTIDERLDVTIKGFTKYHAKYHPNPTYALIKLIDSIKTGN